jgi:hypothetical protein
MSGLRIIVHQHHFGMAIGLDDSEVERHCMERLPGSILEAI